MKKYTIEDLREGRVILVNDGTLEQLREVLAEAFPIDTYITLGSSELYGLDTSSTIPLWDGCKVLEDHQALLPTQSAADFLREEKEDQWIPEEGELVEVSDDGSFSNSYKVRFIVELKGRDYSVLTDHRLDADSYDNPKSTFNSEQWKFMRQIKSTEVTLAQIAEKFGCEVSEIKITDYEK